MNINNILFIFKKNKTKIKFGEKMKNKYILIFIIVLLILISAKTTNSKTIINHYKSISYYNPNNLKRYISYQNKNKNLSRKEIVKKVNMNLDKDWYTDTLPALNINTYIVLVNKYYYLKEDYIPNQLELLDNNYSIRNLYLVKTAKTSFENLAKDAKKIGLTIKAMSTYRSYSYQDNLYKKYVTLDGIEKADTYSARPGYSEHQTGLAIDVFNEKSSYTDFENTEEYKWMQEHAHEYGFILRFPKEKEQETGYQFEAWHYRYVGITPATYIKKNNITLEEYIVKKKPL